MFPADRATLGCPDNSSACLISSDRTAASMGEPSHQHYLQVTGDGKVIRLTYQLDTAPANMCQGKKPVVNINFKCVSKGQVRSHILLIIFLG